MQNELLKSQLPNKFIDAIDCNRTIQSILIIESAVHNIFTVGLLAVLIRGSPSLVSSRDVIFKQSVLQLHTYIYMIIIIIIIVVAGLFVTASINLLI